MWTDCGHGDEEKEGGLHQAALGHGAAGSDAVAEREKDGGAGEIHAALVEQQPVTPAAQDSQLCCYNLQECQVHNLLKERLQQMVSISSTLAAIPRPPRLHGTVSNTNDAG